MLIVHIAFFHEALCPSKIKYSINQGLIPILPHHESAIVSNILLTSFQCVLQVRVLQCVYFRADYANMPSSP